MAKSLEISAVEDTVSSILSRNKHRFQVPEYQRAYAWKEEQLEAFWEDLREVTQTGGTHFLGSVVVIKEDRGLDQLAVLEIIDGQQRLVTISVLLCLMRDRLKEESDKLENDVNPADGIDKKYLWKEDEDFNRRPNLNLSTFDNDEYQELLNGRSPSTDGSQIVEAVEFFQQKLQGVDVEDIDEMRKRLVNSMTLITIQCDSEGSAFKLFETLNDRGLELSAVDLMKNYLFKAAHEAPPDEIKYDLVKSDWESVIWNIKAELTKPERFFRHYLMSASSPDVTDPVSNYKLYDRFCEILDEEIPSTNISVEEYIGDMREKSVLYVDLVQSDIDLFGQQANQEINQKLENLNTLGVTQERTLLLRLFSELENPNKILRALNLLESFVFRWRITGQQTGTDIDEIHAKLCSTIFNDPEPVDRLKERLMAISPDDSDVRLAVRTEDFARNARTRYILTEIENEYFESGTKKVSLGSIEIEHIVPRKAFTAQKYSTWPSYLDISPGKFDEYSDKIGNLTILDERSNARAQDNPFDQKKEEEYVSSEYEMTKSIANYEEWGPAQIENRTERLADVCPTIWSFDY
ncbi:DUF262 domain-containing protein [Halobium palmae]|uniref:DUF262 domain-containing protein n=1 Tax=Halobium palmae TaxID=1776492 RepID=A0ABD5RVC4_9EURY